MLSPFIVPPAGLTPASTWEPIEVAAPRQAVMLVPNLDPTTGEQASLGYGVDIDTEGRRTPKTRAPDPTFQAIAAEFRTLRGSGTAVKTFGHKLHEIRKASDSAKTEMTFEVERLLKPYLAAQLIRVDELVIVAGPPTGARATITLRFTVLKLKQQFTLEVKT